MKSSFLLYENNKTMRESSVFDLISGELETKQTKGLGYLFARNEELIKKFLFSSHTKSLMKNYGLVWEDITHIEVSCEMVSVEKKRADIVIKLYENSVKKIAILIEAKSIQSGLTTKDVEEQMNDYLANQTFSGLDGFGAVVGVILTKYKVLPESSKIAAISWSDLIDLLEIFCVSHPDSALVKEYMSFLLGVNNSMKYYEEEVLSISAGDTIDIIKEVGIYACPNDKNYNYKRKPLYVTFRNRNGGVMDSLYRIDDIIILTPSIHFNRLEELISNSYFIKRIKKYTELDPNSSKLDGEVRFYMLSKMSYDFPNKPHPRRNNVKHTYYNLFDLLNFKEGDDLLPVSQQNK